jgi:AraC-like DNA-binding protein
LGVNDSNLPVREELLHAPEDFPIAQYIKAHYHENLTLQTLAKQFNYNPHYLIEVFQTKMGVTPSHYGFEMQSPKS